MSLRALTWAIYDIAPGLTDASAYRVLLVLADEADNDGCGVYLSAATIAKRTGLSKRTVDAKLKTLEEMGLTRRGDQSIVAYMPANRRPVVRDLNMTPETRGAKSAPQNTTADPTPQPTESGVQQVCNRGATDMQQGCNMSAHNPLNPINPLNPREAAREREAEPQPAAGTEAALAVWQPNAEASALAATAHADLVAEAEKFRCRQLADGKIAKNLDAAFTLWLRRGIEGGYLTPATRTRPSDTRHKATPPTVHRHTWDCEHVKAIMAPHEADYDHTSTGFGNTSAWALACTAEAERLNQAEGLAGAALADGGGA